MDTVKSKYTRFLGKIEKIHAIEEPKKEEGEENNEQPELLE
jgi:hypothetical protein